MIGTDTHKRQPETMTVTLDFAPMMALPRKAFVIAEPSDLGMDVGALDNHDQVS